MNVVNMADYRAATLIHPVRQVILTPRQEEQWEQVLRAQAYKLRCFTGILYTMMEPSTSIDARSKGKRHALFTIDIDTIAATDGRVVLINPDQFFDDDEYTQNNRLFAVGHEIMHTVYDHPRRHWVYRTQGYVSYSDGTRLPYNHKTFGIAADLCLNATLVKGEVGEIHEYWAFDLDIATHETRVIDAYRKLMDDKGMKAEKPPSGGGGGGSGQGDAPGEPDPRQKEADEIGDELEEKYGQQDELLAPGSAETGEVSLERDEVKWDAAIQVAETMAVEAGMFPGIMSRGFTEIRKGSNVNWEDHLAALITKRIGSGRLDFRRPDRRFIQRDIIIPSSSAHDCNHIVVGADTSGSVNQATLNLWTAVLADLLDDIQPQRITVLWCDTKVHDVTELTDVYDLRRLKTKGGGGGTKFQPVFDWIEEHGEQPDSLLYLTDGYPSEWPKKAPDYPVIWGIITNRVAPFGDTVHVPKQA